MLLAKEWKNFWKSWHSKFGQSSNKYIQLDEQVIVSKFAEYINRIYSSNDPGQAAKLKSEYDTKRLDYSGLALTERC